jgi:hypothetical protein
MILGVLRRTNRPGRRARPRSRRRNTLAAALTPAVVVSLQVVTQLAAVAAPSVPAGASKEPPRQVTGRAIDRPHATARQAPAWSESARPTAPTLLRRYMLIRSLAEHYEGIAPRHPRRPIRAAGRLAHHCGKCGCLRSCPQHVVVGRCAVPFDCHRSRRKQPLGTFAQDRRHSAPRPSAPGPSAGRVTGVRLGPRVRVSACPRVRVSATAASLAGRH